MTDDKLRRAVRKLVLAIRRKLLMDERDYIRKELNEVKRLLAKRKGKGKGR